MAPIDGLGAAPLRFCVDGGRILVTRRGDRAVLAERARPGVSHVLGWLGDRPCLAIDVGEHCEVGAEDEWIGLRALHGLLAEPLWGIAGLATQIVEWDRTHRFCGRCATPTVPDERERVRHCPRCGLNAYPRVSPAIIVLVTRGEREQEALLAWSTRWPQPHYSTLAGFVEPGETLEQALVREVREETGITVSELRYFGSQAWPFPHQLMVGFRARSAGGELVLQESEIRDARWFTPDEVQAVTASRGGFSIAGRLIDGWIAEQAGGAGEAGGVGQAGPAGGVGQVGPAGGAEPTGGAR